MSSIDFAHQYDQDMRVDRQGRQMKDRVGKKSKKLLSKNEDFIDNCRTELSTIHHINIDRSSLKPCESPRCDKSYNTFMTTTSRSFSCADLDEVCIMDHFDTNDVTPRFLSSDGLPPESTRSKNNPSSSTSNTAIKNGSRLINDEIENSNLSWISRSLCGIRSSSALENIDDESVNTSFHTARCMPKFSPSENIHRDIQSHDNEEKSEVFTDVLTSTVGSTSIPNNKEKYSTCLVCSKDMYECDCLKNVADCSFIKMPSNSCSTNNSERKDNDVIAIDGRDNTELVARRFLDANGLWCNSWPDWYPDDDDNDTIIEDSAPVLENRARDLNTRRRRLERLRMNLTPFSFLDEELNEGAINVERYKQGKFSRSLSDISPKSVASTIISKPLSQTKFHCDSINCVDEQADIRMNALNMIQKIEVEDTGYDSDPSEILCEKQLLPSRPKALRRRFSTFSSFTTSAREELDHTNFFGKMHSLMNSRKTLIWHTTEDNTQLAVKAWIEPGSQLQSVLIQPKFMWQQTLGKNNKKTERRVLNTRVFHSFDLLDITKIVATEEIDRMKYPFAKRSCSFVIQSFTKEMVFEAVCETERNDIVDGLKMMVARLGSKILVGDGQVLNEFFTPLGASVPGDIPAFITEL